MPRVARKVTPVVTSNVVDTQDQQVGQEGLATMPLDGDARIEHSEIEVIDRPQSKSKLDTLAFMEEKVTVIVAPSTDETEPQFKEVWNGGRKYVFWRGQKMVCERKFIEVLARCKKRVYRNIETFAGDGSRTVVWPHNNVLEFPFQVLDDTPRGKDWLLRLLKEAA